jgi:hypothetical protein
MTIELKLLVEINYFKEIKLFNLNSFNFRIKKDWFIILKNRIKLFINYHNMIPLLISIGEFD